MSARQRTTFTAYVTKYALTKGILVREVEDCFEISPTMVKVIDAKYSEFYHDNAWYRTREQAVVRAEQMRVAKIESLRAQIVRLEQLGFK